MKFKYPFPALLLFLQLFLDTGYAQKMKILPLGNSITFDYNSDDDDGSPRPASIRVSYRYRLYQLLNNAGYVWDYVGNEQCGSAFLPYNNVDSLDYTDNAGYPGVTPAHLVTILNTGRDPRDNSCLIESKYGSCPNNYLNKYLPDIILLHIGTNQLIDYSNADAHAQNVNTILNIIDTYEAWAGKEVVVFLAQIINRASTSGNPEHLITSYYNGILEAVVSNRPNDKIVLVNMETEANLNYRLASNGGDMYDTWHPALSGYEKMANKWFEAINNYNLKAPILGNIPNINFNDLQSHATINLNPYVFDPQDPDNEIIWTTTSSKFNISFVNGVATITPKLPAQSATETITFKARDSGNGGIPLEDTDACTITYTVTNQKPVITGPESFTINEDSQITLSLTSFEVDDDDPYPGSFTLHINENTNYTVINNYTIKPDPNFNGVLTVPVYVNDGLIDSEIKYIRLNVSPVNDPPLIILPEIRSVSEGSLYTGVITVEDPDEEIYLSVSITNTVNSWLSPSGNSSNIFLTGIPDDPHVGFHTVSLRATDTKVITDSVLLIKVIGVNDKPVIMGTTRELYTPQNVSYEITLDDLQVIDPDNIYPDDFSLSIEDGEHYSVFGNTIIPEQGFLGTVSIPVRVYDGQDNSDLKNIIVSIGVTSANKNNLNDLVNIYPNPASSNLIIRINDSQECTVYISDLTGRLYKNYVINKESGDNIIPVWDIPDGLYLIRIFHPKHTFIFKVEIVH